MTPSEEIAAGYLKSLGLMPAPFTKAEMRKGRTPDFRVLCGNELAFYCELKNAQKDRWLDEQGKDALPGTLYGGARPDPIYNRVANYIHSAAGQFAAVNPGEQWPNVLAIVNEDRMAGSPDLRSVLTGNFYPAEGPPEPIFRRISEGRIRADLYRIHLYLWFDVGRTKPHMVFSQSNPAHDAALCRYFGVKPEQIKQFAQAPMGQ
jgi:hypothetical protein